MEHNNIPKMVVREAVLRSMTEEMIKNREAEFVISTEAVDSYNTVFKADGWSLERYAKNPVVLYAHRSYSDDPDAVIGTSEVYVDQTTKQLIGKVRFEPEDVNEKADKIFKKVQAGTLRMASVGAIPLEWRMGDKSKGEDEKVLYFTRCELFEWSIVPVGSNPDALKRSVQFIDEIRSQVAQTIEVNNTENVSEENKELTVRKARLIVNQNLL